MVKPKTGVIEAVRDPERSPGPIRLRSGLMTSDSSSVSAKRRSIGWPVLKSRN